MAWQRGEVWLTKDLLWFREQAGAAAETLALRGPGLAALAPAGGFDVTIPSGLSASRQRRAARRQKERSRRVRAAALVIGSTAVIPLAVHRPGGGAGASGVLADDPPTLTMRTGGRGIELAEEASLDPPPVPAAGGRARGLTRATAPRVEWGRARSSGVPYAGSLTDGTQLPAEGPDWVTWDPVTDSVPNAPNRRYGHERTIRTVISVVTAYRKAHPDAARVVVGDISFRSGGPMDEHVSHQNGLDVDVYYPRRDRALKAPVVPGMFDHALAQDLLDRFVAAGAQMVFVGYSSGLHGPSGVVVPYPNHENHMHVRFPPPQ